MTEESTLERGGCLCGEVRYTFPRTDVLSAHHCHCKDCQKSTGSGKATILFIPVESLNLIGRIKNLHGCGQRGQPRHARVLWELRLAADQLCRRNAGH